MTTEGNSFWTTFMPHGHSYLWRPDILWLNVFSDAMIALVYFSIPIGLIWVTRRRPNIPYQSLITMFSLFILCSGVTHVIGIWTVWHGDYGLQGLAKGITAITLVATATILVPILPKIIALENPQELQLMNQQLQKIINTQEDAQKKLVQAEERFRGFLQQAPDGILIVLKSGKIEYSNDMINTMFGRDSGEFDGKYIIELLPERSRDKIQPGRNDLFDEDRARSPLSGAEFIGMRKDGSEFPLEIRISPILSELVNDETVLVTFRDITERKEKEEIAHQEFVELAHVSRLNTVGEMAAGLAHELNQPFTAISNNLHTAMSMQKQKTEPDEVLLEIMQENYESAQRAGQIIRSLRQLIRKDDGTKQVADMNELAITTAKLIGPEAKAASVEIILELENNLPETLIDKTQVQQVMVNLGRNAIEAVAEQQDQKNHVTIKTVLQDANTIDVHIIDNGPGVSDEIKANLFQPYVTSKKSGMGLGLSLCRTIVESHGGRLRHQNLKGQGTDFCFSIPVIGGK